MTSTIRPAFLLASALAVILLGVVPATAGAHLAPFAADSTAILSGVASLDAEYSAPVGYSQIGSDAVSQDGRYVAFDSESDGLVAGDDDGVENVYVKDRLTGAVTLASRATGAAGAPANDDCLGAAISDDGTRVAFTCGGALDPADVGGHRDVYVRDLPSATTYLVSRAAGLGAVGNDDSGTPVLSEHGDYVAFVSAATNLDGSSDSFSGDDVYRRHIGGSNEMVRVSREAFGRGTAREPSISDDGNLIAFTAGADNKLDATNDTNAFSDVYLDNVSLGTAQLVSRGTGTGAVGNGDSNEPSIAGNGSAVTFTSEAKNLAPTDTDATRDVYRREIGGANATALMSEAMDKGNGESRGSSLDDSGNVLSFISAATNLQAGDTLPAYDAYRVDLALGGGPQLVSRASGNGTPAQNQNAGAVATSGDGNHVAWDSERGGLTPDSDPWKAAVYLRNVAASPQTTESIARPAGTARFAGAGGAAGGGDMTPDGHFAVFTSGAPALGLDLSGTQGVFLRNLQTGATTLVSRQDGVHGLGFAGEVFGGRISANGRYVAFTVIAPGSGRDVVYVRDLFTGRTIQPARASGSAGALANNDAFTADLSPDGRYVTFTSTANNLVPGDTNGQPDVFRRDLVTNQTVLVDRATGPNGTPAVDGGFNGTMTGNGRYVVFATRSKLDPGDTNAFDDVYERDVDGGTTTWVSRTFNGGAGNADTANAAPSADGSKIAFSSEATNLLAATSPTRQIYLKDVRTGALTLISRASGAAGTIADDQVSGPVMASGGNAVTFQTDATNLATGTPPGVPQVYHRNLATNATTLVSRADGATGTPSSEQAELGGMSADGVCVLFDGPGDLLPGAADPDEHQVYLRAVGGTCAPKTGGGGGGGGGGKKDTTPPTVRALKLSHRTFRLGTKATPLKATVAKRKAAPKGTTLSFTLSEPATVTIHVERAVAGQHAKGRTTCRAVKHRVHVRRCTAYAKDGVLTRTYAKAGRQSISFSGRLGKRRLRTGTHRLRLTAVDKAGNRSREQAARFTIVAR
jgi:Tol biopolymer transport system component